MIVLLQKYCLAILATLICFLQINALVNAVRNDEGLERLFMQRSASDWENVWHSESHSRCRDKLVRHLFWACEKDIYRLARRNDPQTHESIMKRSKGKAHHSPLANWFIPEYAQTMLRTRRSKAPSITSECCTKAGCNWEEYAEYCPSNKRRNHY